MPLLTELKNRLGIFSTNTPRLRRCCGGRAQAPAYNFRCCGGRAQAPRNGLCLNALHDRAFDRHLNESISAFRFPLSTFAPLLLPKKFAPDTEFLKRHAEKCLGKQRQIKNPRPKGVVLESGLCKRPKARPPKGAGQCALSPVVNLLAKTKLFLSSLLAEVWFSKSAESRDETLFGSSVALLQRLADDGNEEAASRLRHFRQQWLETVERGGFRYRELYDDDSENTVSEIRETPTRTIGEMSIAERLGRAMIALWQAERTSQPERRDQLCIHAQQLLDVSDAGSGDLLTGFVETRGLVLLAKGDASSALNYFNEQIEHYGRGGWIGLRLGEQRARLMLGQTVDSSADEGSFDSRSARFTMQVANVIQRLTKDEAEQEVGDILRNLYPNAASLAEQWSRASEESASNPADTSIFAGGMIAAFIRSRWFRPAGIFSAEDLANVENRGRAVAEIRRTQNDTFDVLSSAAIAFAV